MIYRGSDSDARNIYLNGATSCQSYESIYLTKGDQINVTIGTGGKTGVYTYRPYNLDGLNGTQTIFGTYSVERGEGSYITVNDGVSFTKLMGTGKRNLGTDGKNVTSSSSTMGTNQSKGKYSDLYGIGRFCSYIYHTSSNIEKNTTKSTKGAVYLRYLD